MAFIQQLRFFYIFSVCVSPILACFQYDSYLIRSAAFRGLVLDGGNPVHISIQLENNSTSQLWNFEPTDRPGLFYIVNNKTGKALDFYPSGGLVLVAKDKEDVLRQQWSIGLNGRITNAENKRNIDVEHAHFTPGNRVIVWMDNGNQAQDFVIESHKDSNLRELKEKSTDEFLFLRHKEKEASHSEKTEASNSEKKMTKTNDSEEKKTETKDSEKKKTEASDSEIKKTEANDSEKNKTETNNIKTI